MGNGASVFENALAEAKASGKSQEDIAKLESLMQQLELLQSENSELEKKNTKLKNTGYTLRAKNFALDKGNKDLQADNSTLQTENAKLRTENNKLTTENAVINADIEAFISMQEEMNTKADENDHEKPALSSILQNYVTLKEDPRVREYDNGVLRSLEKRLLENPDDANAIVGLADLQEKIAKAYRVVIKERVSAEGRTAKWLKITKVGNDDFSEVYDTVWRKSILGAEKRGIEEYKHSVAEVEATLTQRDMKQAHKEFMPLYQEAARVKPAFDKAMLELVARFEEKTGVELDLKICPRLKKVPRIIEKSLLKSKAEGDVSGIKDIVRSMATVTSMSYVATVLQILLQMQVDGLLTLTRIKERFLSQPSGGGWRDIMINITVAGTNAHICEIQVAHGTMLMARKGMPGHAVYNVVRNVVEMIHLTRGSADLAALGYFLHDVDNLPKTFTNWLEDDVPLNEWYGITTDKRGNVVEVDLLKLDPTHERNHELPNLRKLNLSCYPDATTKYIDRILIEYCYLPLELLDLHKCRAVCNRQILMLAEAGCLLGIDLRGCYQVKESDLCLLIKGCSKLHPDKIFSTVKGDRFCAAVVEHRPDLQRIDLSQCIGVTDAGLATLIKGCKDLKPDMLVSDAKGDCFCEAVAKYQFSVKGIDLSQCIYVTDAGLATLIEGCVKLHPDKILSKAKGDRFCQAVGINRRKLKNIDLSQCERVTDTGLATILQECTDLHPDKILSNAKGQGFCDEVARSRRKLQQIDLSQCEGVKDKGLASILEGCKDLNPNMILSGVKSYSFCVAVANNHPSLQDIDLSNCNKVNNAGISALVASCTALTNINLSSCERVTNTAVSSIASKCTALRSINLSYCDKVSDEGVSALATKCNALTSIDLSETAVEDEGISALAAKCPALISINLSCCDITSASVEALAVKCTKMTTINLSESGVDDTGVSALGHNRIGLTNLNLSHTDVGDKSLSAIAANCTALTSIDLSETTIGDMVLSALAKKCDSLTSVKLTACSMVTDDAIIALATHCRQLNSIDMSFCYEVSNLGVSTLAANCTGLANIDLSFCSKVTDKGALLLAENCTGLNRVNVSNTSVGETGISALRAKCKKLTTSH